MAKLTIEEIIAAVKELTVIELNDLVKAAEEEFAPLNTYNFDFSSKEEKNDLLTNDSNEEKNEEDEPKKEKKSIKREKLDDSDYSLTSTDTEETPRRGRGKHF